MYLRLHLIVLCIFAWTATTAQIVNIEDKRKNIDSTGWMGQVDFGGNITKNSNLVYSVNAGFRLDRAGQNSNWIFLADYKTIRAGEQNFINLGFLHLRHGRKISDWLSAEFFVQTQYDERRNLQFRQLLGAGPRVRVHQSEQLNAFLGLLYMYEHDELGEGVAVFNDHRLSSYLSINWELDQKIQFTSTSYYQPVFGDFADSRLSTATSLQFLIGKKLSLTTRFSMIFDARLASVVEGVPDTTYNWTNGIRFVF